MSNLSTGGPDAVCVNTLITGTKWDEWSKLP